MEVMGNLKSIVDANWTIPELPPATNDLFEISNQFMEAAKKIEQADPALAVSIRTIGNAIYMQLNAENAEVPFIPIWQLRGKRSWDISDFSEADLEILEWAADNAVNPVMLARINDVLWIRRRDHKRAEAAISAYCRLVSDQLGKNKPAELYECLSEYTRALVIWNQISQPFNFKTQLVELTEHLIAWEVPEAEHPARARFIEAALRGRIIAAPSDLIPFLEGQIALALESKDFGKQRAYFELKFLVYRQLKDKERAMDTKKDIALSFVEQCRFLRSSGMVAMALTEHYFRAIGELRKVGGFRDVIDQLHDELLAFQPSTSESFEEISHEIDLTDPIKSLLDELEKSSTPDALIELVKVVGPPNKEDLFQRAKDSISSAPLQHLFSRTMVNEKGKVVRRAGGMDTSDPASIEATIAAEAHQQLRYHVNVTSTVIEAGRYHLRRRADVDNALFLSLVVSNPFVDGSHARAYSDGLWEGFNGNWIAAMNILVPQLEHSIRNLCDSHGIRTSKLNDDFIQEERNLNELLDDPALTQILGEDFVFLLQSLLVSRTGFNFRNLVAHGLLSDDELEGYCSPFIWALAIRLSFIFKRAYLKRLETIRSAKEVKPN